MFSLSSVPPYSIWHEDIFPINVLFRSFCHFSKAVFFPNNSDECYLKKKKKKADINPLSAMCCKTSVEVCLWLLGHTVKINYRVHTAYSSFIPHELVSCWLQTSLWYLDDKNILLILLWNACGWHKDSPQRRPCSHLWRLWRYFLPQQKGLCRCD